MDGKLPSEIGDEAEFRAALRCIFGKMYNRQYAARFAHLHVRFHAALLQHLNSKNGRPLPRTNEADAMAAEKLQPSIICDDAYPHAPFPTEAEVGLQEVMSFLSSRGPDTTEHVSFRFIFGFLLGLGMSQESIRKALLLGHTTEVLRICPPRSKQKKNSCEIVLPENAVDREVLTNEQAKEALWAW